MSVYCFLFFYWHSNSTHTSRSFIAPVMPPWIARLNIIQKREGSLVDKIHSWLSLSCTPHGPGVPIDHNQTWLITHRTFFLFPQRSFVSVGLEENSVGSEGLQISADPPLRQRSVLIIEKAVVNWSAIVNQDLVRKSCSSLSGQMLYLNYKGTQCVWMLNKSLYV